MNGRISFYGGSMEFRRRKTRPVHVGKVGIGGDYPVSIQSMTSTSTKDVTATVAQIRRLEEAGCEIVRLGIPDEESARAVRDIRRETLLPLVADIHFDHRLALICLESGVDALRINPGNLRKREHVEAVVAACRERSVPIRIGVNGGSIDRTKYSHPTPEALVDSALGHIRILEEMNFFDIKVSLKASDVPSMVEANRIFAAKTEYPLHLGVTEAGGLIQAVVKSSIGVGALLLDGIGDTVRVSITGDVVQEVETARVILRSLGLRREGVEVVSCPTCARKEFDVERVVNELTARTADVRKYIRVAVMGCAVNGPGEASDADIGVAVGKTDAVLFEAGKIVRKIPREGILDVLLSEIRNRENSRI
jgi:(E)-4-hydroxy-3-methylbut-2-enyl-diphosphate synthase